MEAWLANPELMAADKDAEYAEIIEIDLNEIKEPLLACPNDPDDVKPLSAVAGRQDRRGVHRLVHDQHRPLPRRRQAAGEVQGPHPDRAVDRAADHAWTSYQLKEEGYYGIYGRVGARTEMPGCSLCMGNQARVKAERHGGLDLDAQLPEPPGRTAPTCT